MGAPPAASQNRASARPRYPILTFLRKALGNWRERHRHPFNCAIHLLGIPLAAAGLFLLFFFPWYWGLGAVFLGYLLQYAGHAVEGNDVGEWAAIKRLVGLPYVAIAPRRQQDASRDGDHLA